MSDELTPDTPPIQMFNRLIRMDANTLFCGRSGLTFQYHIQQGSITTLEQATPPQATLVKPRQVIGVGHVGRIFGQATYMLYSPNTNQILAAKRSGNIVLSRRMLI